MLIDTKLNYGLKNISQNGLLVIALQQVDLFSKKRQTNKSKIDVSTTISGLKWKMSEFFAE